MEARLQKFLHQFQHLKIQLEEITSATDNFNDEKNCIGVGGFGKVYKGEVSHSKGRNMAAIKRLNQKLGQGLPEFLKEITMLSRYRHENLVSLLGFCHEADEMILVYEYASRGSLDRHLNSRHLMWTQRLKICLDAAKGLSYLHDPRETHQRLIHCDIKSANILLDDQWNARVSDFGLSVMGPANEQQSVIITCASGTLGYCDLEYAWTHTLTKESDVYSFGVVLFEVLCLGSEFEINPWWSKYNSRLIKTRVETQFLSPGITYTVNLVFKFIFPVDEAINCLLMPLKYKLQGETKTSVSPLAYKTEDGWWRSELYQFTSDDRVVDLEILLDGFRGSYTMIQAQGIEFRPLEKEEQKVLEEEMFDVQPISDVNWNEKLPTDYEDIMKLSKHSGQWLTQKEAYLIICKGFLINDGQKWFSLDKNGRKCHMLSARAAGIWVQHEDRLSLPDSRFGEAMVLRFWTFSIVCEIQPQLVSSQTTYASYLIYKLPEGQSGFEAPMVVKDGEYMDDYYRYIYLVRPQTPLLDQRLMKTPTTHSVGRK